MEPLKTFFQNKKVDTILDVGTGTGDFLKVLKDIFPLAKMVGIDPNGDSLKEASINYPDVEFIQMAGEKLNFGENSFDGASISMALHHLPEIGKTLSEMKRVIKPGGWIIVNELFSDNLNEAQEVHKMYHHFRSATDRLLGISHNETFKKDEIIAIVKQAGIEIIFDFEYSEHKNMIQTPNELNERVVKMNEMLERIKNHPDYQQLKPTIEMFKTKAQKHGFQPAPRVVIVGRL